jgi:hypothetical protein
LAVFALVVAGALAPAAAQAWTGTVHGNITTYAIGWAKMKTTFADDFRAGQAKVDAWDGPNAILSPDHHFNTASTNPSHNHVATGRSDDTRLALWNSYKSQAQASYNAAKSHTSGSAAWYTDMNAAANKLGYGTHCLQDIYGHGQIGKFCHKGIFCTCNTMKNIDVDNPAVAWGGYTGAIRLALSNNKAADSLYGCRTAMPLLFN